MRVCLLLGVLGCGHALPPKPPAPVERVAQVATKPPHAAFSTVPADLIDDAAIDRIRHRVRVRWLHRASPTHGEPAEPVIARVHAEEVDQIMPVIGESSTQIRVVVEDDDARLALWIDKRETWPTVLVPIELADREGRTTRKAGVLVTTGAPIDVAYGRDLVRHVTLRDPDVVVDGWVPSSVVGNVWLAPVGDKVELGSTTTRSYSPPGDPRPKTRFAPRATIRAAPDPTAPIIAVVVGRAVVGFVEARGAWTEVVVPRAYARIRGFVRATELVPPDDELTSFGTGGGHGFGMSHAHRIVVPAGTCLYDKPTGDVVGVQIKESERHGERGSDVDGWSRVYVDSPWAVLGFFVHDTGSDPNRPVWESCARR